MFDGVRFEDGAYQVEIKIDDKPLPPRPEYHNCIQFDEDMKKYIENL